MTKIVLNGDVVTLKTPDKEDMEYVKQLWSEEETMKEVGGPINLSEEKAEKWYKSVVCPGKDTDRFFLIYVDGSPIGEVSFHRFNKAISTAEFNIKIQSNKRGNGFYKEACTLILDYYFNLFNGKVLLDPVAPNNILGQKALEKLGFERTEEKEEHVLLKLTKEKFNKVRFSL